MMFDISVVNVYLLTYENIIDAKNNNETFLFELILNK